MGRLLDGYKAFVAYVESVLPSTAEAACREAIPVFMPIVKEQIEYLYRSACDIFYGDYAPSVYHRTYTMYDVLTIDVSLSSTSASIHYNWEEQNMISSNHDYSGLFKLTFGAGMHGGPIGKTGAAVAVTSPPPHDALFQMIGEWVDGEGNELFDSIYRPIIMKKIQELDLANKLAGFIGG